MTSKSLPSPLEQHRSDYARRIVSRGVIVVVVALMVLQSVPGSLAERLERSRVGRMLDRSGLWQRPWTLFAPDPKQELVWLSATLVTKDGRLIDWISRDWESTGAVDKFFQFRHMNYVTRFQNPLTQDAIDDFARYLGRTQLPAGEVREVQLYKNSIKLLMPPDGTIPSREETLRSVSILPIARVQFAEKSSELSRD